VAGGLPRINTIAPTPPTLFRAMLGEKLGIRFLPEFQDRFVVHIGKAMHPMKQIANR
jgi:hypothetical protein